MNRTLVFATALSGGILAGVSAGWIAPGMAQDLPVRYHSVEVDPGPAPADRRLQSAQAAPRADAGPRAAAGTALPPLPAIPALPQPPTPAPADDVAAAPQAPAAPMIAQSQAQVDPPKAAAPTPPEKPEAKPEAPAATYRPPIAVPQAPPRQAAPAAAQRPASRPTAAAAAPTRLTPGPTPVPPPLSTIATPRDFAGNSIVLEVNRGQVVRLPRAAATVFVANPEIADVQVKSPGLIYVFAKRGGDTTLIAADDEDKILIDARVIVSTNIEALRQAVQQLAPGRQIDVTAVGGQFVLDGKVASPQESEDIRRLASAIVGDERRVINRLKVMSPTQVNLRVRVAEMTKDITKQLGFNWTVARDILSTTSELAVMFSVVNPNSAGIPNKLQFTGRNGAFDVNNIIDAMDQENLIKILAQPNLTAISGQTASFLAGGEFPILVPQGNGTISIEYKKFGVQLAFEPTVLNDNRINLHVRPEVSDLTDQGSITIFGFTIPALQTRRAETTIEIASGQSFAIAGLMRNDVAHSVTKWPGLADIPILGALFRSDTFKRKESELVIIVTPYIVEPVANSLLAAPTDGFRPPHDLDRIFYGAQWRRDLEPGSTAALTGRRPRLVGPAGFQLE